MPEGRDDLVPAAQVLIDCLGLGSRFNNDDVHLELSGWLRAIGGPYLSARYWHSTKEHGRSLGGRTWEMNVAVSNRATNTIKGSSYRVAAIYTGNHWLVSRAVADMKHRKSKDDGWDRARR